MADVSQIPGELNIEATYGDDLVLAIDFDISLTGGYSFISYIVRSDGVEVPFFVSGTNLLLGQLLLSITDIQSLTIPVGDHEWYFSWTINDYTRRILAGEYKQIKYP